MKKRKVYLVLKNCFWYKQDELVFQGNRPKYVDKNSHWVVGKDQIKAADLILRGDKRNDGTAISKNDLMFIGYL